MAAETAASLATAAQAPAHAGRVALIGAASSAGGRQVGQEQTPALFRRLELVPRLRALGLDVDDLGDIATVAYRPDPVNRRRQNLALVAAVARQVAARVEQAASSGALPLVIGGDCTVTLGVLAGLASAHPRLGLIYFDADLDLITPETTKSGIFDGMGLAHILGGGEEQLAQLGPRHPLVPAERVVLFAFQESLVEPHEHEQLEREQIVRFGLAAAVADPTGAAQRALAKVERHSDGYLLHFDVDTIDYVEFPVGEVPHYEALPYDAALACLDVLLAADGLAGVVVTEFNALKDPDATYARRFLDNVLPLVAAGARPRHAWGWLPAQGMLWTRPDLDACGPITHSMPVRARELPCPATA